MISSHDPALHGWFEYKMASYVHVWSICSPAGGIIGEAVEPSGAEIYLAEVGQWWQAFGNYSHALHPVML